jgi:DNA-binding NarL/FixJ family response regulator
VAKRIDLIAAIEAAYDRSLDESAWLERMVHAIAPAFSAGNAVSAFMYELRPKSGAHLWSVVSVGERPLTYEDFRRHHDVAGPREHQLAYSCDMFTLLSRAVGANASAASIENAGMPGEDSLGLRANITPDSGVLLTTFVDRGFRIRDRTLWTRLAAHLGAAGRLRKNQPPATPDAAVAVLTPTGKLEHGTNATIAARTDLAAAAKSIDRARGKMRRLDPTAASELWQAMVRGEWSLVDWFDHDGKRFLLAQDNRVEVAVRKELTERELQVVACAAMGHSNKLIAYDLGVSTGTVAVVLGRAAKKLGVSSRPALIRAYRELVATSDVPS